MLLDSVHIVGFRNYSDCEIYFDKSTLIVGGNDTGKSNLLYALRILFDPTLSARDFELSDGDYNVESSSTFVSITAKLVNVSEPCLISAFKGALSDEGVVYVRFTASNNGEYSFYTGPALDQLDESPSRYYIRQLCMEYVGSNRDLSGFLKRQQRKLLDIAKSRRSHDEESDDQASIECIQNGLESLNHDISRLHYVSESLKFVNGEMSDLSESNSEYEARLVAGNTDANRLVDNLKLAYLYKDAPLTFGGDGRSNQLYFATWMSEQKIIPAAEKEKVTLFAIEEPEAHLHPHQQRRLAQYLSSKLDDQLLISTHSPQIIANFYNGRILRVSKELRSAGSITHGCSASVDEALFQFGYRLNPITSELFFCSSALLVEGVSEKIFYTALSASLGIDLDRLNISIISVEGVGFKKYALVCSSLGIPFVVRTDNDIFAVQTTNRWRYAGVQRAIELIDQIPDSKALDKLKSEVDLSADLLEWEGSDPSQDNIDAGNRIAKKLAACGIFLAESDLESDLATSGISNDLMAHYGASGVKDLIKRMKTRKAENMHDFIASCTDLKSLADEPISAPLLALNNLISGSEDDEDTN